MTRILDVQQVNPLFKVPCAVLIHFSGAIAKQNIPTKIYQARLPQHEMPLAEADPCSA